MGWNDDPTAMMIQVYEEVLEDHKRLVRELDVLINGEAGAAKQASLCDLVAQLRTMQVEEGNAPGARRPYEFNPGDFLVHNGHTESLFSTATLQEALEAARSYGDHGRTYVFQVVAAFVYEEKLDGNTPEKS